MSDEEVIISAKKSKNKPCYTVQTLKLIASQEQCTLVDAIVKKACTRVCTGDARIPVLAMNECGLGKYIMVFETNELIRKFRIEYVKKYNILGAIYISSDKKDIPNEISDDVDELVDILLNEDDYIIVISVNSLDKLFKAMDNTNITVDMTFFNDVNLIQNKHFGYSVVLESETVKINKERVSRLKEHLILPTIDHFTEIMKQETLKDAHVYCVINNISSQKYGPLLEKYIRVKFSYDKNRVDDCTGDLCKYGRNSEVKVSLGGSTHDKFNFVQLRPSHDCDTYILTAYHLCSFNVETEGELYIFKISKYEIKKILEKYGGYAHGTVREHGIITMSSLNDESLPKEYALRPKVNDGCWKALLKFRVHESALY